MDSQYGCSVASKRGVETRMKRNSSQQGKGKRELHDGKNHVNFVFGRRKGHGSDHDDYLISKHPAGIHGRYKYPES